VNYLLDTDTLSNLVKGNPSPVLLRRLALVPPQQQFTSTINIGEMAYGAHRSTRPGYFLGLLQSQILPQVQVVPFDTAAALIYGPLRAAFERQGTLIGEADLRIASIALAHGLTVVTGNVRHFSRVSGLTVENWLA
jgi:tRNA(fMet)-specific endonuclease VapC